MSDISCCFIGHRKIDVTDELTEKLRSLVEELINVGVSTFIFGSRSEFDSLCHEIVTMLKNKYPFIKKAVYTCGSEICIYDSEKNCYEQLYANVTGKNQRITSFDEERLFAAKEKAGIASYLQRNRAMIDDSDYCVFYYDKIYKPDLSRYNKKSTAYYLPRSGTKSAYEYALKKGKILYNLK